ncbi:MAG TPA: NAD-binding protein [Thermoplasmata archaeon]|nr:NAD-binding protein [Thermoplasmata archaeon]
MAGGVRRRFAVRVLSRIWPLLAVFVSVWFVAATGFYLYQGNVSAFASFYWAIVTLSTTGYGDVVPTNFDARLWTICVLVVQLFLLGYLISVVSGIVSEETQHRILGTLGTNMKGHIVVLGYTSVGQAAVRELLAEHETVAVVAESADEVVNIRTLAPESRLYVTFGRPTDPGVLDRANVPGALAVIVCTPDDAVNLIAALTVRNLSKSVRVVVSVRQPELKDTLTSAGVTYVASPGDMAGRLCADAAFRPEVAHAVEAITSTTLGADLQEFLLTESTPISSETLPEAERAIRAQSDCLLIGIARREGSGQYTTVVNPPASTRLRPGDAILVVGSTNNLERFRRWFGRDQGR